MKKLEQILGSVSKWTQADFQIQPMPNEELQLPIHLRPKGRENTSLP
jgi:hypothetical protein